MSIVEKQPIFYQVENYVRNFCSDDATGHDWYHIDRVRRTALFIAQKEGADFYVVELAALLHDVNDWKLTDDKKMPEKTKSILERYNADVGTIDHVLYIIGSISFKGIKSERELETLEAKVVQDADRLDALGAVGIARCFAYGGSKGSRIHVPEIRPKNFDEKSYVDAAKKGTGTSINHFHEKLLLLKELMNTETARQIAAERHDFMERFLEQFYREWEAEF